MLVHYRVKFILHKRKKGDEKGLPIRMRVTLRGQTPIDFPLGLKIDLDKWDSKKEKPKTPKTTEDKANASRINRTIGEYQTNIEEVFNRYELIHKRVPSTAEVKAMFNDFIGKEPIYQSGDDNLDFWGIMDLFIKTMSIQNQWSVGTTTAFRTHKNYLYKYKPNLCFATFTEEIAQGFVNYLQGKGFKNSTVSKQLSLLRWFLRWASQKDYYEGKLHETFKPKFKGTAGHNKEIIYLSNEELRQLQAFQIPQKHEYLEKVRDVFLFQCFTGLRYSDVAKLKRSDIKDGFISVVTQKTTDGLRIELNKHSQAILDKYADIVFPKDLALPIISNQKTNKYLKDLARLAGLNEPTRITYFKGNSRIEEVLPKWELLSSHVGRRTFVVLALQLGIPIEVVMRWTGHKNYEAIKPYTKIVDDLKARSMSRFDDL